MAEIGITYELWTPYGGAAPLYLNADIDSPHNPFAGNYYRVSDVQGLDSPPLRTTVENRPQRDGAIVFDSWRGPRSPMLAGQLVVIDEAMQSRRRAMEDTLRAHLGSLIRDNGTLRWTPSGAAKRRLTVRAFELVQLRGAIPREFQFQLIAGDPTIYADAETVLTDSAAPWSLAAANAGTADAWPVVRVTGSATPVTAVDVRNATTGKLVRLTGINLAAGQWIEVDMGRETAVNQAGVNQISKVVASVSEFWPLPPGDSTIDLTALTGTPSELRATFRSAWS